MPIYACNRVLTQGPQSYGSDLIETATQNEPQAPASEGKSLEFELLVYLFLFMMVAVCYIQISTIFTEYHEKVFDVKVICKSKGGSVV